ncbi:MAG: PfkB family carbohydrate kinase [Myxococcota bacterium]|jgi:sugar/nucleoside kinase (ribokinase family)|nr:PfkB family carbohydrate kinase [Myxococcota bacterium]
MHTLLIGHITEDRLGNMRKLGGGVSFAAKVAALAQCTTTLVTSAPKDFSYWHELDTLNQIDIINIESLHATTFELNDTSKTRSLKLVHRALDIQTGHLPLAAQTPDMIFLGPIIHEVDTAVLKACRPCFSVLGLQGFLRQSDKRGHIVPAEFDPQSFLEHPTNVVSLSQEDHPDAVNIAAVLSTKSIVALTRGDAGATIYESPSIQHHIRAYPAKQVDSTGAGDAFLFRLGLGLARHETLLDAANAAAQNAARVVEGYGLGNLAKTNFV